MESRATILLLTPTPHDPFPDSPMLDVMRDGVVAATHRVGEEFGCPVVPVFEVLDATMRRGPSHAWYDNVPHPGLAGHAVIALEVLRHLGR